MKIISKIKDKILKTHIKNIKTLSKTKYGHLSLCVFGFWFLIFNFSFAQVIPIRDIRQNNANGEPLLLNQTVTFTGFVSVGHEFGSSGPAYVFDNTGGVAVYGSAASQMEIGDSVTIIGTVTLYSGLTEIQSFTLTNHVSGRPVNPILMTIPEISRIDTAAGYVENEGTLIKLASIKIPSASGTFVGDRNYTIQDSLGNTGQIRIDASISGIVGESIPTGFFNLVGVISQYDPSSPYFSGYQVMPRSGNDMEIPIIDTLPLFTIAEVQRPGADGYSSAYEGQYVKVRGRITGPSNIFTSGSSKSLYIQDATNGVNVYAPTYYTSGEALLDSVGAEWYCNGIVTEYDGLTEIAYGMMWISDTNRVNILPRELPFNAAVTEGMESQLIQVTGAVITEPVAMGGGMNFTIKNGTPGITIRVVDGANIPTNWIKKNLRVRVTGIVGQYTSTPPFSTGYQVMPRFAYEIVDLTESIPASALMRIDTVFPNPFSPAEYQATLIRVNSPRDYKLYLEIFDLEGRLVRRLLTNQPGGYYELYWDGTDERRESCPIGIYVLNLKGITNEGKNVFVRKPIVIATKL